MDCFSELQEALKRACPSLELREREPMDRHTTFRIGGPARLMALPKSEAEAVQAVKSGLALGITPFYLGNGSDLLVSDDGVEAFLVKTVDGLGTISGAGTVITAGSGVLLSRIAAQAQARGLGGMEFSHGIPGSLGGAVTMNAGAYDGEMRTVVKRVFYLDATGEKQSLSGPELDFSYRHSAFSDRKRLILGAELELTPRNPEAIQALMDELGARRRSKQPLEFPSAGSAFKRPRGYYAAALIDECGLKGTKVGGARVSTRHAGFIVNTGGATCVDVLKLMDLVRETVLRETGVTLEMEVEVLGVPGL